MQVTLPTKKMWITIHACFRIYIHTTNSKAISFLFIGSNLVGGGGSRERLTKAKMTCICGCNCNGRHLRKSRTKEIEVRYGTDLGKRLFIEIESDRCSASQLSYMTYIHEYIRPH